jgi:hypothetical protein
MKGILGGSGVSRYGVKLILFYEKFMVKSWAHHGRPNYKPKSSPHQKPQKKRFSPSSSSRKVKQLTKAEKPEPGLTE